MVSLGLFLCGRRHCLAQALSCLKIFCIVLISIVSVSSFAEAGSTSQNKAFLDSLTERERTTLEGLPIIGFSGRPANLPFEAHSRNQGYIGIFADYLSLLRDVTGIAFHYKQPASASDINALERDQHIDLVFSDSLTPFDNNQWQSLRTYIQNPVAIVMHKDSPPLASLFGLAGEKVGVLREEAYADQVKEYYASLNIVDIDSAEKGLSLLLSKEISAFLLPRALAIYSTNSKKYSDLNFAGSSGLGTEFSILMNKRLDPNVVSMLRKGMNLIEDQQHMAIFERWIKRGNLDQINSTLLLDLSEDDKKYLRSISPLRFTGKPDWLPYEAFDESGNYHGQVADHLELIASLLGVDFEIVPSDSWSQSIAYARTFGVDVISETENAVLVHDFALSKSYASTPVVIVMRHDENYAPNINSIKDKRIAVVRDYSNVSDFPNKYSHINFSFVDTVEKGLVAVSTGKLDALICNSAQALYHINRIGLSNVKVAGRTEFESKLVFAVDEKYGRFLDLLNKAISKVYLSSEQQEIFNRWNNVAYREKVNYSLICRILIISFFLIVVAMCWNIRLKKEIRKREIISNQLVEAKNLASSANEAKSNFLAAMSHELRTPLNGIMGLVELLARSPLNDEQKNMVHIVQRSSGNLLSILNSILDISKIESNKLDLEWGSNNLKDILEESMDYCLQNAYDKGLQVYLYIDPKLDRLVRVDALRLRQILQNLLTNAIKFTESGHVSLWVEQATMNGSKIEVRIKVEDTGIGISKEGIPLLFDDFVQLDSDIKRRFLGTGLGLSICKQLSDMMGGKITVDSQPNVGTTFFYSQSFDVDGELSVSKPSWRKERFAIFVDDETTRNILRSYLKFYGADIFIPFIAPSKTQDVLYMLARENVSCLFVDEANYNMAYTQAAMNSANSKGFHVIKCVTSTSLSATSYDTAVGELNTNPIQPRSLKYLLDLCFNSALHKIEHKQQEPNIKPHNIKLMVVEDHPINRELICKQLEVLQYSHEAFSDGNLAASAWSESRFDGILTDCHMPGMNGYDLSIQIRQAGSELPIIAMTANAMSGEWERCKKAGMDDILVKPISLDLLDDMLNKWFKDGSKIIRQNQKNKGPVVEKLRSNFKHEELMMSMLDKFWLSCEADIISFSEMVSKGEDYRDAIHRIKGAALSMHAYELSRACERLDRPAPRLAANQLLTVEKHLKHCVSQHRKLFEDVVTE